MAKWTPFLKFRKLKKNNIRDLESFIVIRKKTENFFLERCVSVKKIQNKKKRQLHFYSTERLTYRPDEKTVDRWLFLVTHLLKSPMPVGKGEMKRASLQQCINKKVREERNYCPKKKKKKKINVPDYWFDILCLVIYLHKLETLLTCKKEIFVWLFRNDQFQLAPNYSKSAERLRMS